MRRLPLLLLTLAACDSNTVMMMMNSNPDLSMPVSSGDMAVKPGADMTMLADLATSSSGGIPDPGSVMSTGSLFIDPVAAPDDTPAEAVKLGIITPDNMGTVLLWVTQNTFTTTDQTDYAVFKASAAGTFQLGSTGVCASAANVLAKIDLWQVSGGAQVTPPVHEWTATGGSNCIPGTAPLVANTEYLIGFFGGGVAGSYSA